MNPINHVMSPDHSLAAYHAYFTFMAILAGIVAVISWLCTIVFVTGEVKSLANQGRRPQRATSAAKVSHANRAGMIIGKIVFRLPAPFV